MVSCASTTTFESISTTSVIIKLDLIGGEEVIEAEDELI